MRIFSERSPLPTLRPAQRIDRLFLLAAFAVVECRAQHLHRLFAVLRLRALLLRCNDSFLLARGVMRIADSVLLTCWPPAPEALYASTCRYDVLISTSASFLTLGKTATVAVLGANLSLRLPSWNALNVVHT